MTGKVGIIVNPIAGNDIRRIVANASFITNVEKINITKRLLAGLDASGISEILLMPDFYGIAQNAIRDMPNLNMHYTFVDMNPEGDYTDSIKAAELMKKDGVDCIITLGGDGTVRVVSKASNSTPLLPLSTGTNNVIPYNIDATIAGLAAGAFSLGMIPKNDVLVTIKRIDVFYGAHKLDYALVDVATTLYQFRGSRALWNPYALKEIVTSLGMPMYTGLTSLAGMIKPFTQNDEFGMYIRIGKKSHTMVSTFIAPGMVTRIPVEEFKIVKLGEKITLEKAPTIALDGEREIEFPNESLEVMVTRKGPKIIDLNKLINRLIEKGYFVHSIKNE
jgi:predicted polyphosphate/ATP-dependent NAD kinase